jgi:hypothetical protein
MTTFWKPTPNVGPDRPNGPDTKKLGNRVYVLWCRCDVCHRSNSSPWFQFLTRGGEDGHLCWECATEPGVLEGLGADGWTTTSPHYTTR